MAEEKFAPDLLLDLWSAAVRTEELVERSVERTGMPAENFALHSMIGMKGPITPTAIAERTGVPLSTVVFRVRKLIVAGFVRRAPNPNDRRSYLLTLTDEGRQVLNRAMPGFRSAVRSMQSRLQLPPHQVQAALRDLVKALTAELESSHPQLQGSSRR